jgi:hypothetical protein
VHVTVEAASVPHFPYVHDAPSFAHADPTFGGVEGQGAAGSGAHVQR